MNFSFFKTRSFLCLLVVLFAIASSTTFAVPKKAAPPQSLPSLRGLITTLLPNPLRSLQPGEATESEVEKSFGKPPRSAKDTTLHTSTKYYVFAGIRFDTSLVFNRESKLQTLIHHFGESTANLELFRPYISEKQLQAALARLNAPSGPRSADVQESDNPILRVEVPEEGLVLHFKASGSQKLMRVEISSPSARVSP